MLNVRAISNCVYKKARQLNMEGSQAEPQSHVRPPPPVSDAMLVERKQPPPSSGRRICSQPPGANNSLLGLSFCAGENRGRRRKGGIAWKVIAAA